MTSWRDENWKTAAVPKLERQLEKIAAVDGKLRKVDKLIKDALKLTKNLADVDSSKKREALGLINDMAKFVRGGKLPADLTPGDISTTEVELHVYNDLLDPKGRQPTHTMRHELKQLDNAAISIGLKD